MRIAYQINMLQLARNHNAICVFLKCPNAVEVNGRSSPDDAQRKAEWHLKGGRGSQAKVWPGVQDRRLQSGTACDSVGGAFRSGLAGEPRRNCHLLKFGAPGIERWTVTHLFLSLIIS